jgi:hypothetical protein
MFAIRVLKFQLRGFVPVYQRTGSEVSCPLLKFRIHYSLLLCFRRARPYDISKLPRFRWNTLSRIAAYSLPIPCPKQRLA